MGNVDREINPTTRDYVEDPAIGATKTTRNQLTAIYHQAKTELDQWWGDPDAGGRLKDLSRSKSLVLTPIVIQDIWTELLQPLIDDGRITEPVFESVRKVDRIDVELTVTDLQSGEELKLTDLLPFDP